MNVRPTVLCHGVFDVLHVGHLRYFEEARRFGGNLTWLVVSVTADRFVRERKGPTRPYFPVELRCEMLRGLRIVDEVIVSESPSAVQSITRIQPDFYVKGPDYRDLDSDPTGLIYLERDAVERFGGQLVFTESRLASSSDILRAFALD